MNERIRELEDQCWVKVPCDFDMNAGGLSTIRTVFDRKKFAELLIRECANIDFRFKVGMTTDQEFDTGRVILEHFGVSE